MCRTICRNIEKFLLLNLLLFGFAIAWANNPVLPSDIHVMPQTTITGLEQLHVSTTAVGEKAKIIQTEPQGVIYVHENTTFTVPEELLHQVVVLRASTIKLDKKKKVVPAKVYNIVPVAKAIICRKHTSRPFGDLPQQGSKHFITSLTVAGTSIVNHITVNGIVSTRALIDFLLCTQQYPKPILSEVAITEASKILQAQTIRPPPFC